MSRCSHAKRNDYSRDDAVDARAHTATCTPGSRGGRFRLAFPFNGTPLPFGAGGILPIRDFTPLGDWGIRTHPARNTVPATTAVGAVRGLGYLTLTIFRRQHMTEKQDLLEAAQEYCDPKTGEVLERIPDELMKKLRAAMLARGIPGKPSQRTGSSATWFVFLNSEIRDRVLALRCRPKGAAKHGPVKGTRRKGTVGVAATKVGSKHSHGGSQGLGRFLNRRKTDQ